MNIGKSKGHLKAKTVMDIAHKDRPDNQVFFNTPREMTDPELVQQALLHSSGVEQIAYEHSKRVRYNAGIKELDPRYTALTPLDGFIVRLMVREAVETKSGLILPSIGKAQGKTRNGYDDDVVNDPYNLSQKAIIVATAPHETILVPGTLVHIAHLQTIVHERQVVGYEAQYLHPDYPHAIGPKDVADQDFGYALVSRARIRVIIAAKGSF